MDEFAFTPIVNRSEVGSDGMVIATSKENYVYAVDSLFQVRRANVGFRVTSSGVQKSSNMQATTPTWDDI